MLKFNNKVPTDIKIGNKTVEKILMRNEVVWGRVQEYFYIENTYNGSNRVDILVSLNNPTRNHITELQYSTDKLNWTTYQLSNGSTSITLSQGQRVYFRNDSGYCNTHPYDTDYWVMTFNPTQSYIVGGNINSLLDYTNMYNVTLPSQCYYKLFNGSSTLTSAADLTLVSNRATFGCYTGMFMNCSSLVTPPVIKATIIADSYCFQNMFYGCVSLTTSPSLPATTLKNSCYKNMFRGCSSLTTAPELPATTLANSCYQSMFQGDTSLVNPPDLPAATLKENCYYGMFLGCSSLNHLTVYANDNSATNCTLRWLENVASTGTFINYGTATYTYPSVDGIPQGWADTLITNYFYVKNESSSQSNVNIVVDGTPKSNKNATSVQYSYDRATWSTINFSPNTTYNIPLNSSQKVYFRNGNGFWSSTSADIKFFSDKDYSVGGKLSTLYDCYNEGHTTPDCGFKMLFSNGWDGNNTLVDASMLQLVDNLSNHTSGGVTYKTIPERFYQDMFWCCVNLLHSPEEVYGESVGEMGCDSMFLGCRKLLDAPKLSPIDVSPYGYREMFSTCESLLSAPEISMTKVDGVSCKEMFYRCKKMTGNPTLLPETIENNTYESMFEGCTSLTEVTLYLRYYSGSSSVDSHQGVYNFLKDANPNGGTIHNLGGFSSGYWAPSGWVISNT